MQPVLTFDFEALFLSGNPEEVNELVASIFGASLQLSKT